MQQLCVGDRVPDFSAPSNGDTIEFLDHIDGSWALVFSYPSDFTPVCHSELAAVAKLAPEFDRRGVKVMAISGGTRESHIQFMRAVADAADVDIKFPIVCDSDGAISAKLGMVPPAYSDKPQEGMQRVRVTYVITPEQRLALSWTYPASVGRNFAEALRCIDALKVAAVADVGTPANWQAGEDVVVLPSVPDNEATAAFPRGFTAVKPYLRIVPQPEVERVRE